MKAQPIDRQTPSDAAQPVHAGQPSSNPQGTQETTVTQLTPDDVIADGGPIAPVTADGAPTERQVEQDVVSVNPSLDSMESRG